MCSYCGREEFSGSIKDMAREVYDHDDGDE